MSFCQSVRKRSDTRTACKWHLFSDVEAVKGAEKKKQYVKQVSNQVGSNQRNTSFGSVKSQEALALRGETLSEMFDDAGLRHCHGGSLRNSWPGLRRDQQEPTHTSRSLTP